MLISALFLTLLPASLAQTTHTVQVGPSDTLNYVPPVVTALPNDIVRFEFYPKNHTVTQSSFFTPCVPMPGGASSGFVPVSQNSSSVPTWDFRVTEVLPTWFFCAQTAHCGLGMVFAINAELALFDKFRGLAELENGNGNGNSSSVRPL